MHHVHHQNDLYNIPQPDNQDFDQVLRGQIQDYLSATKGGNLSGQRHQGVKFTDLVTSFLRNDEKPDFEFQFHLNSVLTQENDLQKGVAVAPLDIFELEQGEAPIFDQNQLVMSDHAIENLPKRAGGNALLKNKKFQTFLMGSDRVTARNLKQKAAA